MSAETWSERAPPSAQDRPAAQPRVGRARPKLGVADLLLQLWRAKWLMLAVLVPILVLGIGVAFLAPTKHAASARLLVRLGQEYVYNPVVGEAGKGAFLPQEEMMQTEIELASSPVIAERVINVVGLAKLYPRLAETKLRSSDGGGYVVDQEALETFAADLNVKAAPKSSILHMTFEHENPDLAAATLNRFVSEYVKYRQEVLSGNGVQGLSDQRKLIEERLALADETLQNYLASHNLGDFEAENAAATKLLSDIADERSNVDASLREAEARIAGLSRQLGATDRLVDLYVEAPVKDIDRKTTQPQGDPATVPNQGLRRIGPNPTWQALEADRAVQTANISALKGRAAALSDQISQADQRITELASLQPDYQRLKRDRDALETSAAAYAAREQSELARNELASRSVDNISVYEAARPPTRGDDAKSAIVIAAVIFGLIFALAIGLLRARSATGFATANSLERTLGVRVLASARER